MQTFLPYASFFDSAAVLHMKHLGKQRVENLQIMKALADPTYGWQNHPAVRMWRGHELMLMGYQTAICFEWHNVRGYKDTCLDKTLAVWSEVNWYDQGDPAWLGDEEFHAAMRSNLLRKKPEHYSQFGWTETDDRAYIWPV